MKVDLRKAERQDLDLIHKMQVEAFMPLLEKYHDYDMSPAMEPIERIIQKFEQSFTDYYLIIVDGITTGAIRILRKGMAYYRVSPIFILPKYQGKGIAQGVFIAIENQYADAVKWELDTILQETGNCHLYEKVGYLKTGKIQKINEYMTIVFYEKHLVQ